jgi:Sec-independent protein secretion pathway component TatC
MSEQQEPKAEKELTLIDHLIELRDRLIKSPLFS